MIMMMRRRMTRRKEEDNELGHCISLIVRFSIFCVKRELTLMHQRDSPN
jgi:hypothetical protein